MEVFVQVLHFHLDQQEVAFVAITNHILDAAKTNRAVSLFRPTPSKVFSYVLTMILIVLNNVKLISIGRLGNIG